WNSRSKGSSAGDYVGNSDNSDGSEISSTTGATYKYKAGNPYDDNYSDTLADIAMEYWKKDLRDKLDNNVPNSAADPAFWQHMVTFGVAIGLRGELDPAVDLPALVNGSKDWPNPS